MLKLYKIQNTLKHLTATKRIVTVTLVVATVTALLGTMVISTYRRHANEKAIDVYKVQEDILAEQVAQAIEKGVKDVQSQLELIAKSRDIINSEDTEACNLKLQAFFEIVSYQLGNLGRVDKEGIFKCSLNPALIGTSAAQLGDYVPALIADPEHKPVMSRKITPPGITSLASAIHVPVYDVNNEFSGTVGGAIYFEQVHDQYLKHIRLGQNGFAVFFDDNGDILYHPEYELIGKNVDDPDVIRRYEPTGVLGGFIGKASTESVGRVEYSIDGTAKIGSYKALKVPGRKMVALVTLPIEEAEAFVSNVGLNTAFPAVVAVLTLSIALMTFMMLLSIHKILEIQAAKDQFISLVSHQLRTPLTSIRLFIEMLGEEQVGKLNPQQKDYISKVDLSTERMIRLVGDILNVTRIELGRIKIEPVPTDFVALIESRVEEVKPLAAEKQMRIHFTKPAEMPQVSLDGNLMGQVVHNLLTNAIHYSKTDGNGLVTVKLVRQGGEYILSVSDNGIGIPKEAQKRLFQRFYRAENAIKTQGDGTGLGLYLIMLILKASGGTINFESTEGKGTTFYVRIPASGMKSKSGDKTLN